MSISAQKMSFASNWSAFIGFGKCFLRFTFLVKLKNTKVLPWLSRPSFCHTISLDFFWPLHCPLAFFSRYLADKSAVQWTGDWDFHTRRCFASQMFLALFCGEGEFVTKIKKGFTRKKQMTEKSKFVFTRTIYEQWRREMEEHKETDRKIAAKEQKVCFCFATMLPFYFRSSSTLSNLIERF